MGKNFKKSSTKNIKSELKRTVSRKIPRILDSLSEDFSETISELKILNKERVSGKNGDLIDWMFEAQLDNYSKRLQNILSLIKEESLKNS